MMSGHWVKDPRDSSQHLPRSWLFQMSHLIEATRGDRCPRDTTVPNVGEVGGAGAGVSMGEVAGRWEVQNQDRGAKSAGEEVRGGGNDKWPLSL